jgi:hypothetical protein
MFIACGWSAFPLVLLYERRSGFLLALPRSAATSIAVFMPVLDARWVGLEGYKRPLPQRGGAH